MSYGYGGRQNPFDQRDESPAPRAPPQGAFGQGPRPGGGGASRYNQPAIGRDEYGPASNVEMAPLAQNAGGIGGARGGDPNAILNECRDIDQGIDQIERNLSQLRTLQDRALNDADTSATSTTSRQLDALSSETMAMYRGLTERVRLIKSDRDSQAPRNSAQVGRVDRRLKAAITEYQQVESSYRKRTQDQMARQYRIVRPDASESEVRAAVEDSSQGAQVFQQALMQSDRRGQARAVLSAVQDRHAAIQKIERQMVELAQLFQDMDTLVVQQQEQVAQIEMKGEEVVENIDKGNVELGGAVKSARGARRKKWICLGICVAILVIIAIVVAVYVVINNKNNGNGKRSLDVRGIAWGAEGKPVPQVYAQSKIVIPGVPYNPAAEDSASAPLAKFPGLRGGLPAVRRRYVEWSKDELDD